jgi:hypothetical protein
LQSTSIPVQRIGLRRPDAREQQAGATAAAATAVSTGFFSRVNIFGPFILRFPDAFAPVAPQRCREAAAALRVDQYAFCDGTTRCAPERTDQTFTMRG